MKPIFMTFDKVTYAGRDKLKLNGKVGEICAPIKNCKDLFVVDFGHDSYIMTTDMLKHHVAKDSDDKEYVEKRVKDPDLQ